MKNKAKKIYFDLGGPVFQDNSPWKDEITMVLPEHISYFHYLRLERIFWEMYIDNHKIQSQADVSFEDVYQLAITPSAEDEYKERIDNSAIPLEEGDCQLLLLCFAEKAKYLQSKTISAPTDSSFFQSPIAVILITLAFLLSGLSLFVGYHFFLGHEAQTISQKSAQLQQKTPALKTDIFPDPLSAAPFSEKVTSDYPTSPPKSGVLIHQAKEKANRLDAWLSFTCSHCKEGWNLTRSLMRDKSIADSTNFYFQTVVSKSELDMLLGSYFLCIAEQNPSVALDFADWAFKNQTRLKVEGKLRKSDLDWLVESEGIDYAKLKKDMTSNTLKNALIKSVSAAEAFHIKKTPTIFANQLIFEGKLIDKDKIVAELKKKNKETGQE